MSIDNTIITRYLQQQQISIQFPHDITSSCDIMDSPFSENMVSLKRLVKLNKESKCERKVNFLH